VDKWVAPFEQCDEVVVPCLGLDLPQDFSIFVNHLGPRTQKRDVGPTRQKLHLFFKPAGHAQIVGIESGGESGTRLGEAMVQCYRHAFPIDVKNPNSLVAERIGLQYRGRPVNGTVVDNNQFKVGERLSQYAVD
jgi:hypothetical protein